MSFTHLEVHSQFSLLAASARPADLVARAVADGMARLALTDTNALYGAVAFARACREVSIQPILGMSATVAGDVPGPPFGRLVLLAKDPAGYTSLCRLASLLQGGGPGQNGAFYPALAWDDLRDHRTGLVCLSGGRQGWIERYLHRDDLSAAQTYAGRLAGIFGDDACLALHLPPMAKATSLEAVAGGPPALAAGGQLAGAAGAAKEVAVAREMLVLGRRLGIAVAAVQPVYSLAVGDARRVRLLAAIRCNCPLDEIPADELPGGQDAAAAEWHWLPPDEVQARFAAWPQALLGSAEIAGRCGQVLPDGSPIWPTVPLPPGQTPDQALAHLARAGLADKYGVVDPGPAKPASEQASATAQDASGSVIAARLERELTAIVSHGYAPLFLVVADIVRFAHAKGVPVSTRGSVANSLAAYCAGITDVDPVAHGLLFERFLSPARRDAPDIDLDLCSRRRDEVLAYVRHAYGANNVALVGTVSTLRLPSAIRAAAKAHGLAEAEITRLAARLPRQRWRPRQAMSQPSSDAPGKEHEEASAEDQDGEADTELEWYAQESGGGPAGLADVPSADEELARALAQIDNPVWRLVIQDALTLVGQPDHMSVHPGGIIITPGPLTDIVPVQWARKGFLITQYEHDDVASLGLPKIDLLGVRALTVLADAAQLVRRREPAFRLEDIPAGDQLTGDLLAHGDTIGVFQCESDGARATLCKLKARNQSDLAIANAFFKPGPSTGGMAHHFVRRYRGDEEVSYLHEALAPILGPTKGVLIFQEQVLRIATELAGLDWGEADRLRRGMSRMERGAMAQLGAHFVAGCRRPPPAGPGLSESQAVSLWRQVAAFAGYGFNQGHALAYAAVSYRSAYLRAHWPAEFLCARLADAGGFHHPVIYIAEAIRLGYAVRPPHINHSVSAFSLDVEANSAAMWMGLGWVRELRQASAAAMIAERDARPFASLVDLLARVDLHPKEVRHLIQCGALDGLPFASGTAPDSRAGLLAQAEQAARIGKGRAGGAVQLAFAFDEPRVSRESPAQRCAWEVETLGVPLAALAEPALLLAVDAQGRPPALPDHVSLAEVMSSPATGLSASSPHNAGRRVVPPIIGIRLPGWTGGPGFFLWDGQTLVTARLPRAFKTPPPWQLLVTHGRPAGDGWGTWWFEVDQIRPLSQIEASSL